MSRYVIIAFLLLLPALSFAQSRIKWMTIEQAYAASKKNPRKILVEVYTDKCGYCKKLDNITFNDSALAARIHEEYYPVKLNANLKTPINLGGRKWVNRNSRDNDSVHEFARDILNGKMQYPTVVILDSRFNAIAHHPGYVSVEEFSSLLDQYADN